MKYEVFEFDCENIMVGVQVFVKFCYVVGVKEICVCIVGVVFFFIDQFKYDVFGVSFFDDGKKVKDFQFEDLCFVVWLLELR